MVWLVEDVYLPPQGRIYSSCHSALKVRGKSRAGALSLPAKQLAPQALNLHMPVSTCTLKQPLRDTPGLSSLLCRFFLSSPPLIIRDSFPSSHGAKHVLPEQGQKMLSHSLLIMCHGYIQNDTPQSTHAQGVFLMLNCAMSCILLHTQSVLTEVIF